jgi:ATP adenylyltransferase
MDRLWAPWRIGYLADDNKEQTCFLCEAGRRENDAASFVVRRADLCFAILNRYPYNNGHLLIAPYAHKADLPELTAGERAGMMDLLVECQTALAGRFRPQGFNVGLNLGSAAGAGLPGHLHMHVLPRWAGDTGFVSTCADTKIIGQSLEAAYEALTAAFREGDAAC